jgi:hypothetical protein
MIGDLGRRRRGAIEARLQPSLTISHQSPDMTDAKG